MIKEKVVDKINECKRIFTKHADVFFKLNEPALFSEISDSIEHLEYEVSKEDNPEFLKTMYDKIQNFIDIIESTDYFYSIGKYNLSNDNKDFFSKGIRTHSDKSQGRARLSMNQDALSILDDYVSDIDFYTMEILKKVPISHGCMTVYKNLNFVSALQFCDENEAGVTMTIRVRATIRPREEEVIEN